MKFWGLQRESKRVRRRRSSWWRWRRTRSTWGWSQILIMMMIMVPLRQPKFVQTIKTVVFDSFMMMIMMIRSIPRHRGFKLLIKLVLVLLKPLPEPEPKPGGAATRTWHALTAHRGRRANDHRSIVVFLRHRNGILGLPGEQLPLERDLAGCSRVIQAWRLTHWWVPGEDFVDEVVVCLEDGKYGFLGVSTAVSVSADHVHY